MPAPGEGLWAPALPNRRPVSVGQAVPEGRQFRAQRRRHAVAEGVVERLREVGFGLPCLGVDGEEHYIAMEHLDFGASVAGEVADLIAGPLGWSDADRIAAVEAYRADTELAAPAGM